MLTADRLCHNMKIQIRKHRSKRVVGKASLRLFLLWGTMIEMDETEDGTGVTDEELNLIRLFIYNEAVETLLSDEAQQVINIIIGGHPIGQATKEALEYETQ